MLGQGVFKGVGVASNSWCMYELWSAREEQTKVNFQGVVLFQMDKAGTKKKSSNDYKVKPRRVMLLKRTCYIDRLLIPMQWELMLLLHDPLLC